MHRSIDSVSTISYRLQYRNVNHGVEDSVFWSSSQTWVTIVPSDTIFGAYLHIRQQSRNGRADYYYDGTAAIDMYHQARGQSLQKTVTIVEPYPLGNGDNAVQSRTTVRGYCEELLSKKINARWAPYLDSMQVEDGGETWRVKWVQRDPAEDHVAQMRLAFDKRDGLLRYISQHSVWRGVQLNQDAEITRLRINAAGDEDSVRLTQTYEGYSVKYDRRRKKEVLPASSLGKSIGRLVYPNFEGNKLTLLPPAGQYLLLDFWETWCGYCFVAMPKLKALHGRWKDSGLQVVGVVSENRAQVAKIIEGQRFPYPTVWADTRLHQMLDVVGRPRYVLVDSEGRVVADTGSDLEAMEAQLERLLGKR